MWDLNHAERRAIAASVFLVGLAGVSRVVSAPLPEGFEWRPAASVATGSPRDEVAMALARETRAQTPLAPGERIDIATAPEEELRRLTGVGPSLASAIIRERAARPFRAVRDLDRVPGIGPATFDRLKDLVEIGSSVLAPPPPAASGSVCGDDRVELNSAPSADLETLPGVGPALAGRILEARAARRGFDRLDDLQQVSGIGEVTFARLAPLVCVR